jgi:hypothetical protein
VGKLEEHDNELRRLARDPAEAMRRWAKLAETDRITVITYMAGYYDIKFARIFLHETKLRKRPDLSILITNDRSVTSDSLKAGGYRKFSDAGGVLVWVHPTGKKVWLLSPPKTLPPPPPASDPQSQNTARRVEDPNVEEARETVEFYEKWKRELNERAAQIRRMKGTPEYARALIEWRWQRMAMASALAHVRNDELPDWQQGLNARDRATLDGLMNQVWQDMWNDYDEEFENESNRVDPKGDIWRQTVDRHGGLP